MRIILARCSAIYTGKTATKLEVGDRVIMIKDDGSILIQNTSSGIKPKNYMPAGTIITETDSGKVLCATNTKTQETLEIFLHETNHDLTSRAKDDHRADTHV